MRECPELACNLLDVDVIRRVQLEIQRKNQILLVHEVK